MNEKEWLLIKAYIDAKIDYETANVTRERDENGYLETPYHESKALDHSEATIELYLKNQNK